jgi:phosphoribosylanthranilate isomerase
VFVKICGITRAEDADLATELGASALGFVFWPGSPRYISEDSARDIVRRNAGAVASVGVFVDQDPDEVARIVETVGLNMAQLHGSESADYCRTLASRVPKVIKAIGLRNGAPAAVEAFGREVVILVDAHDPARHGGTGQVVNWETARQLAASRETILAGGLRPENVADAVRAVAPYGVDVSSGVESAPGVKDATRLRSFFEALHG